MPLGKMRTPLRTEVCAPKNAPTFERARQRHAALREYANAAALLAFFRDESPARMPEKETIARVLLVEQQRGETAYWSSLLTLMYLPMLIALERRIKPGTLASDEIEQIVLAKFMEAISSYRVHAHADAHTFVRIAQRTAKRVYRVLGAERLYAANELAFDPHILLCLLDANEHEPGQAIWPDHKKERWDDTPADLAAKTALLMEHGAEVLPIERLQLVLKTYVGGESLRDYLRRKNADLSDAEFERLYQRTKRQHSRDVTRLRRALRHLRHPRDAHDAARAPADRDAHAHHDAAAR